MYLINFGPFAIYKQKKRAQSKAQCAPLRALAHDAPNELPIDFASSRLAFFLCDSL